MFRKTFVYVFVLFILPALMFAACQPAVVVAPVFSDYSMAPSTLHDDLVIPVADYTGGGDCSADRATGDLYLQPDWYCLPVDGPAIVAVLDNQGDDNPPALPPTVVPPTVDECNGIPLDLCDQPNPPFNPPTPPSVHPTPEPCDGSDCCIPDFPGCDDGDDDGEPTPPPCTSNCNPNDNHGDNGNHYGNNQPDNNDHDDQNKHDGEQTYTD